MTGFLLAQEPQASQQDKKPEPNAGAGNGPKPGPGAAGPSAHGVQGNGKDFGQAFFGLGAKPDPEAVARGQKAFVANCGFCHGSAATGGNSGPNLVRSVLVLHDEGTGKEIGPVLLNGRVDKGMPKFAFNEGQIHDIAAFLLERSQATVNRMTYKTQNIVTGDASKGQQFFAGHCETCHSATGDLAHVGSKFEPEMLQSKLLYPAESRPGPGPKAPLKVQPTVTVTDSSGNKVEGVLTYLDDFSVSLVDSQGETRTWSREVPGVQVAVHDPLQGHAELLPQLTDADMHNLLAYLVTLK